VRSLGLSREDAVVIRLRHSQILAMMFSRQDALVAGAGGEPLEGPIIRFDIPRP
jgi:hypothetical protein